MIALLILLRRASLPMFLGIVACSLLAGTATTALLGIVNGHLTNPDDATRAAGRFVLACAVALVAGMVSQLMLARLSVGILYGLRVRISEGIVALPYMRFESLGTARLRAALTEDIPALSQGLVTLPMLVTNLATVLGALAYLGYMSGATFLLWIVVMLAAIASLFVLMAIFGRLDRKTRQAVDRLYEGFEGLIEGAVELRLHAARRRQFMSEAIEGAAREVKHRGGITFALQAFIESWSRLLLFVALGLVLFLGSSWIGFSEDVARGFVLVVMFVMAPLGAIMALLPQVSRASIALSSVNSLDAVLSEPRLPDEDANRPKSFERLELTAIELTRKDDNREFRVGPVDLSIEAGRTVFIVGGNGSGKSTLAKMIAGLYPPDAGTITVDGRTVDEDWEWYRQHVSAVFADFHVFSQLWGIEGERLDERAREHLALLDLTGVVNVDGGRLSTVAVSTGQKKRLALLVAMLEDRPLCVFDEWAADQDPGYKRAFYEDLLPALRRSGRAVVVVTHDDRYFHLADEVVTMRDGRIDDAEAWPSDRRVAAETG